MKKFAQVWCRVVQCIRIQSWSSFKRCWMYVVRDDITENYSKGFALKSKNNCLNKWFIVTISHTFCFIRSDTVSCVHKCFDAHISWKLNIDELVHQNILLQIYWISFAKNTSIIDGNELLVCGFLVYCLSIPIWYSTFSPQNWLKILTAFGFHTRNIIQFYVWLAHTVCRCCDIFVATFNHI